MAFNPSQPRVPAGGPGGGEFGAARSSDASKAQQDKTAQALHPQVMKLKGAERKVFLRKLSDSDLEKLTAALYSSKTSNKDIVAARMDVAAEMTRRGIDIKKYGALGGGLKAPVKATAKPAVKKAAVKAAAKKAPVKVAAKKPTPAPVAPARKATGGTGGRSRAI